MKGMVIDPRGRLRRRWFVYDLILPNIAALLAIVVIKAVAFPGSDLALGAIALLLLWSANFAAPIARFHDLGLPSYVHLIVVVVVFALTTIGPVSGPGEVVTRLSEWIELLRGEETSVSALETRTQPLAGLIALVEILVLAFVPGRKGPNRFGPDPREAA